MKVSAESALSMEVSEPAPPMETPKPRPPPPMDASESSSLGKVCIVCTDACPDGGGMEFSGMEFRVFVVELNLREIHTQVNCLKPAVRFDFEFMYSPAFCVVGSTLYIFEGYNWRCNPKGKSMYTYQLADGAPNVLLDKSMLSRGPDMIGFKELPRATPTPNGKIVVFSSVIDISYPNEFDFEIYDPVGDSWRKLPSLRPSVYPRSIDYCWVKSHTFMDKNVLCLNTDLGVYTLNIATSRRRTTWQGTGFRGDESIPGHLGTSMVLIKNEICMLPEYAFDIRELEGDANPNPFFSHYYTFPELTPSFSPFAYSHRSAGIVLLEEKQIPDYNYDYNVCILDAGLNEELQQSELRLQVYSCNLKECKEEFSKHREMTTKNIEQDPDWLKKKSECFVLPGTRKATTLSILSNAAKGSHCFSYCSFSAIPQGCRKSTRKRTHK